MLVNGVAVVRDGKHTGALPGRIVRGPGYRPSADPMTAARSGGMAGDLEAEGPLQP